MSDRTSRATTWGLGDALLGLFLGFFGASLLLSLIAGDTKAEDLGVAERFLANVPLWLAFILVPMVATLRKGNGPEEDLGLRIVPLDALAIPIGVAAQLLVGAVYGIFVKSSDLERPARDLVDSASGTAGTVLLILMTAVIAPFAEELFFRGLVMKSLEKRMAVVPALILTSAVFAGTHFGQWLQFPGLFVFALVAGLLALRTGRLGTSMAFHLGFNLTSVLLLLG